MEFDKYGKEKNETILCKCGGHYKNNGPDQKKHFNTKMHKNYILTHPGDKDNGRMYIAEEDQYKITEADFKQFWDNIENHNNLSIVANPYPHKIKLTDNLYISSDYYIFDEFKQKVYLNGRIEIDVKKLSINKPGKNE